MRTLLNFCILTALFFSVSASAQEKLQSFIYDKPAQSVNISADRLLYIDNLLQEYVDKGIIPHALTFVAKNGVVVHNKAFGWNNIENKQALKKDDIFRNFSQTKAIVTVALMTLFEKGKFLLDDPVSKYIPEYTDQVLVEMKDDGSYSTRKAASPLLIRHLMSHTSGVMGNNDLTTLFNKLKEKRGKQYDTLEEEVKDMLKFPLAFDPGTQWSYHPSTDVCGYLVEYFSGKSLREYVKETILTPLGMKDTDWYYPDSYKSRMVTAYNEENGKLVPKDDVWSGRNPFSSDTRYCKAGTGLNGSIEDYARFCQMILNGGTFNGKHILGRRTIEMMAIDQLPHPESGGPDFCFGLGFMVYPQHRIERANVSKLTTMVSPGSLSWGGYYNTDYLIDPKENLIILLYTNRFPDIFIWERFVNTVYQALE
jgi:CubicO group peptidase (beta-lactamase class C family)